MRIAIPGRKNAFIHFGTVARGRTEDASAGEAKGLPAQDLKLFCFGYQAVDTGCVNTTVIGGGSTAQPVAASIDAAVHAEALASIDAAKQQIAEFQPKAETEAEPVQAEAPASVPDPEPSPQEEPPANDFSQMTEQQLMSMTFE